MYSYVCLVFEDEFCCIVLLFFFFLFFHPSSHSVTFHFICYYVSQTLAVSYFTSIKCATVLYILLIVKYGQDFKIRVTNVAVLLQFSLHDTVVNILCMWYSHKNKILIRNENKMSFFLSSTWNTVPIIQTQKISYQIFNSFLFQFTVERICNMNFHLHNKNYTCIT